jgi:ABC-type spermidine/putrescine transport system permease subunit I
MLANLIEFHVEQLNWGFASAIAILLLIGTISCVILIKWFARRFTKWLVGGEMT